MSRPAAVPAEWDPEDRTATTWTPVIPTKARVHPTIALLLKTLLSIILDRIAVVTIAPPFDICHTELSTVFKAK